MGDQGAAVCRRARYWAGRQAGMTKGGRETGKGYAQGFEGHRGSEGHGGSAGTVEWDKLAGK